MNWYSSSRAYNLRKRALYVIVFLSSVQSCLSGCSSTDVTLAKEPLSVERRIFSEKESAEIPLEPNEAAVTVWRFGLKTDFGFDVVEKTTLRQKDLLVTIKIKSVHLALSAPVIMYLPEGAPKELVEHEEGHLTICRRIYDKCDADALAAGKSVIGKEFQASGPTVEDACRSAIERASESVFPRYHSRASVAVNRLSDIYDQLDRNDHAPVPDLIKKAFSKYHTELRADIK